MKYSFRQYAEALALALKDKNDEEYQLILKRLVLLLRKDHDGRKLNRILVETERLLLKNAGKKKITIASAAPLSQENHNTIQALVGPNAEYEYKIQPELKAGMTVLINDSVFIDGSAATNLETLFR
jgi:F0F1-type ATP synthase delta subunit